MPGKHPSAQTWAVEVCGSREKLSHSKGKGRLPIPPPQQKAFNRDSVTALTVIIEIRNIILFTTQPGDISTG